MDFASLGIRIQTSEVKAGAKDLDQLTTSAQRAETAVEKIGKTPLIPPQVIPPLRIIPPLLDKNSESFKALGISVGQYKNALRQVPAQLTDIFTSLAGGQNPLLVAIQQGGQLRDSFGGFGNTLRGLLTILTPARLAIGGLAGIAATIAVSFKAGQEESAALANAIVIGGNAAGVTASQLRELAQSIDAIAGTESQAASALALLTASGKVAGSNLKELAEIAVKAQLSIGTPIEETVKQFTDLGRDPVNSLKKLNDQFNFLTASTLRQVSALVEQGRQFEAGALAQEAFKDRLTEITKEAEANLGSLQRLGKGVVKIFNEATSALLNIGRTETSKGTLQATLKEIQGIQDILDKSGGLNSTDRGFLQQRIADRKAFSEALKEDIQKEQRLADQQAAISKQRNVEVNQEAERLRKKKELAAMAEQIRKAQLGGDLAGIKRALSEQQDLFANNESRLDLLRSAGLIKDAEFFDRKRQLIEESTAAQVAAKEAENQRLRAEKTGGVAQLQTQQTIKDNESDILRLRQQSAAQLGDLTIQQQVENNKLTRSYGESKAAADAFIKSLDLQFERQQQLQGLGTKARERQGQRDDLSDRFQGQRDQVQGEFRRGEITQETLDREVALIDETSAKAAAAIERNFAKIDMNSMDAFVGAREALNNYLDDAKNVAQQSQDLFSNAFRGAEDALVEFATTGKLSFKGLAQSIVADLIRIQIRALIVRAIAGSGIFGGAGAAAGAAAGSFSGPRAAGGPVTAGRAYLVGERGPELIVPRSSGTVIPANKTASMLGGNRGVSVTINQSVNMPGGVTPGEVQAMLDRSKQETVAATRGAIMQDIARGRFDSAFASSRR